MAALVFPRPKISRSFVTYLWELSKTFLARSSFSISELSIFLNFIRVFDWYFKSICFCFSKERQKERRAVVKRHFTTDFHPAWARRGVLFFFRVWGLCPPFIVRGWVPNRDKMFIRFHGVLGPRPEDTARASCATKIDTREPKSPMTSSSLSSFSSPRARRRMRDGWKTENAREDPRISSYIQESTC